MKFRSIVPTLILILAVAAFGIPANAQLTITGPSNGFCSSQPALTNGAVPGISFKYVLYGAGQLTDPNCGGAPSTAVNLVSDEAVFAANSPGYDIVGAGNLQGLLVRIGKGSGNGFTIHVWIMHPDGTTSAAPVITCSAGTNAPGTSVPDCTDTTTIVPVVDKDKVAIFITGSPGDTYQDIHWYLGKT